MRNERILRNIGLLMAIVLLPRAVRADDWPMWRYDAARSASSAQSLASALHLQWVRDLGPLTTAWPDQPKMVLDRAYEPVVAGRTMFVGSSKHDTVTAYDTRTGETRWVFHADGPVRYAPVVWERGVYFTSDDGHLYCVEAATGSLTWKFRGGPARRRALGNQRLISSWPARGAPVIADATVYFAASIWPFMGIFIHALDARTGEVVWTNDGDGSMYIKQPHTADSFAGVAPQGPLVVAGDVLLIPGGRSIPAAYDRKTGKLIHYLLNENNKRGGGSEVFVGGEYFYNGGQAYRVDTGAALGATRFPAVPASDGIYASEAGNIHASDILIKEAEITDRRGRKVVRQTWATPRRWSVDAPAGEVLIRAGARLYGGTEGALCAVDLPTVDAPAKLSWETTIEGTPTSLVAADDRLFAVTREGRISCFGADRRDEPVTHTSPTVPLRRNPSWKDTVRTILDKTGARSGYAVALGVGGGGLVAELITQSDLFVIVIEPDGDKVRALKERLIAADLYGTRTAVHQDTLSRDALPPYLANLVVSESYAAERVADLFRVLRPYGGVAVLPIPPELKDTLDKAAMTLPNAQVTYDGVWAYLSRPGALPGSGNWTHEHADASNTRVATDTRVKAPLGLLWFGGPSHDGILPRHGHGPQPQVIDGRILIEGVDMLRALDVYTGRLLWETSMPGVGTFFDNTNHQPGANASGTNYISTSDGIYVAYGLQCLRLDPDTGDQVSAFSLPGGHAGGQAPQWGYINVVDDLLIGTGDPLIVNDADYSEPMGDVIFRWELTSQSRQSAPPGHYGDVNSIAYSPDGLTAATGSVDKTIKLWEVATGSVRHTLTGHEKGVFGVAYSPDGTRLASAGGDMTVRLWDPATGEARATLKGHLAQVAGVAFSPDGKTLASASFDATIKLWDVATDQLLATLEGHKAEVNEVAFSPDGRLLLSGSEDKTAKLWDVATRKLKSTYAAHGDHVNTVAFAPDGATAATGSCDRTTHVWNPQTGKTLDILSGHTSVVNAVAFSPDGTTLATGSRDRRVILWDVATRKQRTALTGPKAAIESIAFSPDGAALVSAGAGREASFSRQNRSSSLNLTVMNRHSGKVFWTATAESGFRHNAICVGGGRLYCIDRMPPAEIARLKRRGGTPDANPTLRVLDLYTGEEVWKTDEGVFGTWLSYSAKHDVVVEAGRVARDSLSDEPRGMRAFRAADGKLLWSNEAYVGPAMLHGDIILKTRSACDLLTGAPVTRKDPITGRRIEWTWSRTHGCNTPAASQNLLTFRSGAAGYYDLANDGGTGNFGGFKSSCTNNLIVANGVLAAPDYTRTCVCSYQNQTSLALIHDPEVEMWTQFDLADQPGLATLGLNLGAPGSRRAADGRLWLNRYPHATVEFDDRYGYYNRHATNIDDDGLRWVAASGCRGIKRLEVDPKRENADASTYTVRLHFADPDNDQPGQRVFDVGVQGKTVLAALDIVKQAGGRNRTLVKQIEGVTVTDKIVLTFTNGSGDGRDAVPLLCGVELLRTR